MTFSAAARRLPVRLATGAYIANSGAGKLKADDETAKRLHESASGTYSFLENVDPKLFAKGLAVGEMALGGALLLPIVPAAVAGAGLLGFSGALLTMYWKTPGMHQDGDPRPTPAGMGVAKDVWMAGIGAALIADGLLEPAHDKKVELTGALHERRHGKARRKAKREAKQARAEAAAHLREVARERTEVLSKRAANAARERGGQALEVARDRGSSALDVARDRGGQALDVARDRGSSALDVARDRGGQALDVAREQAHDYGTRAAKRARKQAKQARKSDAAKQARALAHEAAERAKVAADRARDAAERARNAVA